MIEKPFSNREIELMLSGIDQKLTQVLDHVKETNGRVHKLEIVTIELERQMEERDANLEKLILQKESHIKQWVLKALLIVTLASSFVWIKESRDAILDIIRHLI